MALDNKNAGLFRRFKFYGFGFLLGILLVSFVYKGRGCQMPGDIKLEELSLQPLTFSAKGKCLMECNIVLQKDVEELLKEGRINYDESDVRGGAFPVYAVEGTTGNGIEVQVMIEDIDTISIVKSVVDMQIKNEECDCLEPN